MFHLKNIAGSLAVLNRNLSQVCKFSFAFITKRTAQDILKDYFSHRLSIAAPQLEQYMVQLSKCQRFSKQDDRWGNLCVTIQRNLVSFDLKSKITILLVKCLAKFKQNNMLFSGLLKQIIANIDFLTFEDMSKVAWSLVKTQTIQKNNFLLIYKRVIYFLDNDSRHSQQSSQGGQSQANTKQNIILTKKQLNALQVQQLLSQNSQAINISGKNYVLFVWSLMKSKIIDKKLLIKMTKIALRQSNIQNISIEDQCLLFHCLTNLQMQKIRSTKHLTQSIMSMHKQVQNLNMLSLVLLIQSFSHYIYQRKQMTLDNDNFNQVKSIQSQLQKNRVFVLFTLQTIVLRHNASKQNISYKFASILMFHLTKINLYEPQLWKKLLDDFTHNIDQAETQDLTMAIQAISRLSKAERAQVQSYEIKICKRIWQIYNSIHGKSLSVIQQLISAKQIFPPHKIQKDLKRQNQLKKHEKNKLKLKQQNSQNNNQSFQQVNDEQSQQFKASSEKRKIWLQKRQNRQSNTMNQKTKPYPIKKQNNQTKVQKN